MVYYSKPLTQAQESMLWQIKLLAYDFFGATSSGEAQQFANEVRQNVDNILRKHGLDPVVHIKEGRYGRD